MPISIVQCTDLSAEVCEALGALPTNGNATGATLLVGADCQLYTLPPTPVDLNVTSFSVSGNDLVLTDQDGDTYTIPLNSLVQVNDCDGNPINFATTGIATCQNVTDAIQTAFETTATDCAGAVIDLTTTPIATCANLQDPALLCDTIQSMPFDAAALTPAAEILVLTPDCHRANIGTIGASLGALDCAGDPLNLTGASLAQCADVAALQAQIDALTTTINNILAALANTDTLTDCNGNVLATYIVG